MQRRPNIGSALSDLGFAVLALIAGWRGETPQAIAHLESALALAADRSDLRILLGMRAKAQEAGIWLPHMPEEWGGMGLGHVELAMVQAEEKGYLGMLTIDQVAGGLEA